MGFRYPDETVEHAVREYVAGKSASAISREIGTSADVVTGWMRANGIQVRPATFYPRVGIDRVQLPTDEVAALYEAGESEFALARRFDATRASIRIRLKRAGVHIRNQSEAEALKWSRMTEEQRTAQVRPAHRASAGRAKSIEEKSKIARTRQAHGLNRSSGEFILTAVLESRGVAVVPQQAVGIYNCDIGAFPVAIELFGGGWHWYGGHARIAPDRIRFFMEHGWSMLMIRVDERSRLTEATADMICSYMATRSDGQDAIPEYRVVRANGEPICSGRLGEGDITIEYAFTLERNPETGRYSRVLRA